MTRDRIALATALCTIAVAGLATAGDLKKIADLSSKLDKAHAQKAQSLAAVSLADESEPTKTKEKKVYDQQMTVLEPQVDALLGKFEAHGTDAAAVNKKIDTHNSGCKGALPKSAHERCKGELPYLTSEQDRIDEKAAALEKEKKSLSKQVKLITDRRDELIKEIAKLQEDRKAAKVTLAKAEKAIDALTPLLRKECQPPNTPEALAYCGQVDWDGARAGLPAPELKPKPLSVTPNSGALQKN